MVTSDGLYKYDNLKKTFIQYSRSSLSGEEGKNYQGNAVIVGNYIYIGSSNGNLIRMGSNDGSKDLPHSPAVADIVRSGFVFQDCMSDDDGSFFWISTTTWHIFIFLTEKWNFTVIRRNQTVFFSMLLILFIQEEEKYGLTVLDVVL
jgi:hypothetical protein